MHHYHQTERSVESVHLLSFAPDCSSADHKWKQKSLKSGVNEKYHTRQRKRKALLVEPPVKAETHWFFSLYLSCIFLNVAIFFSFIGPTVYMIASGALRSPSPPIGKPCRILKWKSNCLKHKNWKSVRKATYYQKLLVDSLSNDSLRNYIKKKHASIKLLELPPAIERRYHQQNPSHSQAFEG